MPRVDVAYDLTHLAARSRSRPPVRVLGGVRGVLRAGTATLFIAAPGSGGSVLLRLLTAQLGPQRGSSVLYNGATAQELESSGVAASRLCGYVDEVDEHEATLTVRETLEFVERMAEVVKSNAAPRSFPDTPESPERAPTADEMISLLGLDEAASTVVGSAAVRGVSGGQRRRLTIAEALLLHPCVLALDKPTTGLDADTALRLIALLTSSARRSGATLVAVLQQPSAEVVACFDEIALLSEGRELFHGPARGVEEHFASVAGGRLQRPLFMRRDEFLFELVASPLRAAKLANSGGLGVGSAESAEGDAASGLSIAELAEAFEASAAFRLSYAGGTELTLAAERRRLSTAVNVAAQAWYSRASALARNALGFGESASSSAPVPAPEPAPAGLQALTPYERERFGLFPTAPVARQMRLLLGRQARLLLRNRPLLAARLVSTVLIACILGSMLLNKLLDFVQLYGISLFAAVFFAMSNNVELPTMAAARRIVYRHLQSGLYSPFAYISSIVLASLPLALLANIAFSSILYFTSGFNPRFLNFLWFALVVFSIDLAMAAWARLLALSCRALDVANAMTNAILAVWLLLGGFYLIRSEMPHWLSWAVWLSPFWYSTTSIALNEFRSERWSHPSSSAPGAESQGALYLAAFDIPNSRSLQALSVVALIGLFAALTLLSGCALDHFRFDSSRGTQRTEVMDVGNEAAVRQPHQPACAFRVLPTAVVFSDLSYTIDVPLSGHALAQLTPRSAAPVQTPRDNSGVSMPRTLLSGLSGFCCPGHLTAMMGASGAGKSTLLDVLAHRKSSGRVTGEMQLVRTGISSAVEASRSGGAVEFAYCEQEAAFMLRSTVRETVHFSSTLRCGDLSDSMRNAQVGEALELLELSGLQTRQVITLSRGETKRLAVAVELVSNSPVVFLDEPTTALDSRSAATLMRALRRVVETGRTVVCTVHQPSAEIFFLFDRLLLLSPGGRLVYLGPVGEAAREVTSFMSAMTRISMPSSHDNPAEWAMTALRVMEVAEGPRAAADYYAASDLRRQNVVQVQELLSRGGLSSVGGLHDRAPARSFAVQFAALTRRWWLQLLRNQAIARVRVAVALFISVVFGNLYLNVNYLTFAGTQSSLGLLLGSLSFASIGFLQTTIALFFDSREAFYRESAMRFYVRPAYGLSLLVSQAPWLVGIVAVTSSVLYWAVGLRRHADSWAFSVLAFTIAAGVYASIGAALGALAPTPQVAQVLAGLCISLLIIAGGLFVRLRQMPVFWIGLDYASPIFHLLRAQAASQFFCVGAGCPSFRAPIGEEVHEVGQWQYVSTYLSSPPSWKQRFQFGELGFAAASIAVLAVITVGAVSFVRFECR